MRSSFGASAGPAQPSYGGFAGPAQPSFGGPTGTARPPVSSGFVGTIDSANQRAQIPLTAGQSGQFPIGGPALRMTGNELRAGDVKPTGSGCDSVKIYAQEGKLGYHLHHFSFIGFKLVLLRLFERFIPIAKVRAGIDHFRVQE